MLEKERSRRSVTATFGALGLGLALWGCADAPGDAQSAAPAAVRAQEAAAIVDYGKPGPHAVVEENNLGAAFATTGFDDTAVCEIVVPTLTNGKATPEQLATFIKYPASLDPTLHSITRPKVLAEGTKHPVVIWGNGTCAAPIYYRALLSHLASHGFVVITPNSRQVGSDDLLKSLAVLTQLNETPASPYYQKLDLARVGTSGHAQGGVAAIIAAEDPRVGTILPIASASIGEPGKPVLFLTGERDAIVPHDLVHEAFVGTDAPAVYALAKQADHVSPIQEAFLLNAPVAAWFRAELLGDPAAKAFFRGPDCTLCGDPGYAVEAKQRD